MAPSSQSASPADRHSDAERACALLDDLETLMFGVAFTPAHSGQVNVSSLKPVMEAISEALPSLKRVLEAHDEEKAEVADGAYAKGRADARAEHQHHGHWCEYVGGRCIHCGEADRVAP